LKKKKKNNSPNNNNESNNNDQDDGHHNHDLPPSTIIHLQQGEILIHKGDLEHSGVDITSGVRRLMIAFLACEWQEDDDHDEAEEE
jgi:hypothetical protein